MKLIINVPAGFLEKIQKYITEGKYSRLEEFVEAALINQINLEEQDEQKTVEISVFNQAEDIIKSSRTVSNEFIEFSIYQVHENSRYNTISTTSMPQEKSLNSGPLWGQYNRIFPIKLTLRLLANITAKENANIKLEEFREKASEYARRIGLELVDVDNTKKRSRGTRVSTALPIGVNSFKSKNRYKNHFIGSVDKKGSLWGAPAKLKLISITGDDNPEIRLTEPGLEFALLENPLLDHNIKNENSLSAKEVQYYIKHVFTHVNDEANIMKLILSKISNDVNRPSSLTKIIKDKYNNMTESQANTIRSGLISRMSELNLIRRKRLGLREIIYELTEEGKTLLNKNMDTNQIRGRDGT